MRYSREEIAERRKKQLLMAAICGPLFAGLLTTTSFIFTVVPHHILNLEHHWFKVSAVTSCTAMAFVADRLGKHLHITPRRFASPVAFSCALFAFIAFAVFASLN